MQDDPSITIMFNLETLTPTAILYNSATDTETAKLRSIADMMLKALPEREAVSLEEPEL